MFNKNLLNSFLQSSINLNWFNQIFSNFIFHCCIILPDENDSLSYSQINIDHIKTIKQI